MQKIEIKKLIAWGILIILFLFMHCYKLGDIPYGINVDEMGMGYDAWCLSHYGTDRYLNSFPVYLTNYGGGQSALYAYLCAPFVYILGITTVAIRIPAVLFSILTLVYLVKIVDLIWKNPAINYMAGIFYTITPVFLFLSRIGLDCNLMLGASMVFIYYLLKAVQSERIKHYVLAGVFGGIVLYTYVLSHLMLPLFLLLILSYMFWLKKIRFRQMLALGIPLFILALSLMLFHLVNITDGKEFQLGFLTITKLYGYRGSEIAMEEIGENLWKFFRYTLGYDYVRFNSVDNFFTMYIISIPVIIIGLISAIKQSVVSLRKKEWNPLCLVLAWFISIYCIGITLSTGGPTIYRVNAVFLSYALFWVEGITVIVYFIKKLSFAKVRNVICVLGAGIYLVAFVAFAKYYFCDYAKDTYLIDLFNFTFEDVLEYISEELPDDVKERMTYIGDGNQTYMFYLCSTMTSPFDYNQIKDDTSQSLTLWTESFQNYYFNFPEKIDPAGNYIVPDTSYRYIEEFEAYGLEKVHIGNHYLFWNSWLSEETTNAESLVSWDHGVELEQNKVVFDAGDSTTISGWALDTTNMEVWDDIIIEIDGKHIVAEKMTRQDVADVMSNDSLVECGFVMRIPKEDLKDVSNVKVRFINYDKLACYVAYLNLSE